MVMKNFTVRDIKGLFSDWNFDGYGVDIATESQGYTDNEFAELKRLYGYTEQAISE
jgi:hypothetical protein